MEPTELRFRAMGSPCRIVTDPNSHRAAEEIRSLVEYLERCWSRFLHNSEVSAVNRAAGRVTVVSDITYKLIANAVRAHDRTGGRFNPLMLEQLMAIGYDRTWTEARLIPSGPIEPATLEPIDLYPTVKAVRIPAGTAFDPGGIGKGLAVDLAIERCQSLGLKMASVELGGDLKVYGKPWFGDRWTVGAASPFLESLDTASFSFDGGAVTTSTTARRRWNSNGTVLHHLLDPTTGRPSTSDVVSVTTCSALAWWGEVASKVALLAGSTGASRALADLGVPGIVVTNDGQVLVERPTSRTEVPV
ncbi:MAG: FAD:protein FMN transferase [Acidimicrobiia bacterium]|nr:FAD:protein FMN transferase [Acidimicrobiia bacterium]